jgi:phosphoribosylanthranilate isomerase
LRRVRVKICGLTQKKDLDSAIDAGADAVGFLVGVPSSPRNLTFKRAKVLLSKVPIFINSVVVTTPKNLEWLFKICKRLKPTAIQIHGKMQLDYSKIHNKIKNIQLIKTVYVTDESLNKIATMESKTFDAILLDSFSKAQYGGTGRVHDWTLSKQIKEAIVPVPVILAGGLNPQNVQEAILKVQPYAVDVASGVELNPGIKDHKKVRAFIENAKEIKLPNN